MTEQNWFRGNIHTHTTESDGDAEPPQVVRWYREHGYDFLVLTDHNHLTLIEYGSDPSNEPGILMIPGEEVTVSVGAARVPVHLNGIGISHYVEPTDTGDVASTLQANIDAILSAGGIASINHPTYKWAFDHTAILKTRGASLLEIFNYDPETHNYPVPLDDVFSPVEIWDRVLTAGLPLFGVAVDDSHHYHDFGPDRYNPGRGWVMVEAEAPQQAAIVDSLASGRFYSSTGVFLDELNLHQDEISLRIRPRGNAIMVTQFIGADGRVFHETVGHESVYRPTGDEGYIRAWIRSSGGAEAWTQPLFLD